MQAAGSTGQVNGWDTVGVAVGKTAPHIAAEIPDYHQAGVEELPWVSLGPYHGRARKGCEEKVPASIMKSTAGVSKKRLLNNQRQLINWGRRLILELVFTKRVRISKLVGSWNRNCSVTCDSRCGLQH